MGRCLGNVIWFLLGGVLLAANWFILGILYCITIIGIPIGLQCFKFARVSLWPFGTDIEYSTGGCNLLINVIWLVLGGFTLVITSLVSAILLTITIVGIPWARQSIKIMKLALMPFGSRVVNYDRNRIRNTPNDYR